MIFISLGKWKQAPTKDMRPQMDKFTQEMEELAKQGIKIQTFWTLGRYDGVAIIDAPTEKDAMKLLLTWEPVLELETLTAIPRDEAIELL
jgi:uncharacterized protein with GYD domain